MSNIDEAEIRGVLNRASGDRWKDEPRLLVLVRRVIAHMDNELLLAQRECEMVRAKLDLLQAPGRSNYLYHGLPEMTRIEIATQLGLYQFEPQTAQVIFARAQQEGKLDALVAAIEKATSELAYDK